MFVASRFTFDENESHLLQTDNRALNLPPQTIAESHFRCHRTFRNNANSREPLAPLGFWMEYQTQSTGKKISFAYIEHLLHGVIFRELLKY
jgi:hypothetical protein